jgi:hypothetical protein
LDRFARYFFNSSAYRTYVCQLADTPRFKPIEASGLINKLSHDVKRGSPFSPEAIKQLKDGIKAANEAVEKLSPNAEANEIKESIEKAIDEAAPMTKSAISDQREKTGVWNVTFNGKNATEIRAADADGIIRYERGGRKGGAIHIAQKHIGEGKYGELTKQEITKWER